MKRQTEKATATVQKLDELIQQAHQQAASIAATIEAIRLKVAEHHSQREREESTLEP